MSELHFFSYVKDTFFTVSTNTQLVECWVKDANECYATGKYEHIVSLIGICCSATVFEYKHDSKIEAREQVVKGNQYFSTEKIGERIDKRTRLVEKDNRKDKIKG